VRGAVLPRDAHQDVQLVLVPEGLEHAVGLGATLAIVQLLRDRKHKKYEKKHSA
jgi:hypothetical protein